MDRHSRRILGWSLGRNRNAALTLQVHFGSKSEIFAFIHAERERFGVSWLCRRYGVTRAGYYAWCERGPSAHADRDAFLAARISAVFVASEGTYGAPRIHAVMAQAGVRVSRKRIARLMVQAGLKARASRVYRRTPGTQRFFDAIPNRVLGVVTTGPNQIWVGDVTYLRVGGAWRYLAVVMDRHSRRILGWSLGRNRNAALTLSALNKAIARRGRPVGVIFHSDRGVEFSAYAFRARLAAHGMTQSMKRPRELGDNAFIESFFHSMKSDVIQGVTFDADHDLSETVARYMRRYNRLRLHSSIGYRSPIDYERSSA
ncbi:MAG: IS3 family transposase [bacterium]